MWRMSSLARLTTPFLKSADDSHTCRWYARLGLAVQPLTTCKFLIPNIPIRGGTMPLGSVAERSPNGMPISAKEVSWVRMGRYLCDVTNAWGSSSITLATLLAAFRCHTWAMNRGWATWSVETKRMGVCSGWGLEGLHISQSSRWSSHLSLISCIRPGYGVIRMVVRWVAMDAGNNQTKDFPWPVAMWMAKLVVF